MSLTLKRFGNALILIFILSNFSFAVTYYVSSGGDNNNSGLSWPTAFETIQKGVDTSSNGDIVLVATGIYYEQIDFSGKSITIQGTDPNDWNVVEATVIDANDLGRVVTFENGEGAASVLSGFTITGGYATGSGTDDSGAGIFCYSTSPMIQNCLISDNYAAQYGGGIYTAYGSPYIFNCVFSGNEAYDSGGGFRDYSGSPVISDCNFINNTAWYGAAIQQNLTTSMITDCSFSSNQTSRSGGYGGAIRNLDASPVLTGCNFLQNSAYNGGAISNSGGVSEFSNCFFYQNSSSNNGGAVINQSSTLTVFDACIFEDNSAVNNGGAIRNESSPVEIQNSLFVLNDAGWGAAIHNSSSNSTISNCTIANNSASTAGGGIRNYSSAPDIINCILWGNTGGEIADLSSSPTVTYSDIDGGYTGIGNFDIDPNFVDFYNKDYHLTTNSPCIDAGNPSSNYSNEPEPNGDIINLGAYGNTIEAASTLDSDGDTLSNPWEVRNGLNPTNSDTDDDGMPDNYEIDHSLDPLDPDDIYDDQDSDGYLNYTEYLHNGDPSDPSFENITLTVPTDKNMKTIEEAIHWSLDGDVVLVLKGEYRENVDYEGKAITLTGSDICDWNTVQSTVIIADDPNDAALSFVSGEDANSIIAGIQIAGGTYGIYCSSSSPVIKNCIIEDNTSHEIHVESGSPLIINNMIGIAATTASPGAGIYSTSPSSLIIKNNFIYKNDNNGIVIDGATSAGIIRNNTIVYNTGNGIEIAANTISPQISNCILWQNSLLDTDGCTAIYSCIEDSSCVGNPAVTFNISGNPDFLGASNYDYRIDRESPCVDKGDPNSVIVDEYDIEGEERVARIVDMGADEVCEVHNITADIWYQGIQDAIDEAVDGDIIEAYEWEYAESINFSGLSITLKGTNPSNWKSVESTIINPSNSALDVVTFNSGEDANSILMGFTITGGQNGIVCSNNSSSVIQNCLITENANDGISCVSGAPIIRNNKITNNLEDGIDSSASVQPLIKINMIYGNLEKGVKITNSSTSNGIYGNTIAQNGYGIYVDASAAEPDVRNCIIWDNDIELSGTVAYYSCLGDPNSIGDPNTAKNICENPLFVDETNSDFHISSASPCIGVADETIYTASDEDIDSQELATVYSTYTMGTDSVTVYYVNGAVSASGVGTSWETAFKTLQEALDQNAQEIWVAQETYSPESAGSSFQMYENLTLLGGFYGNESTESQRDPYAYKTYLSGNIDEQVGADAYCVVRGADNATIDGFVIQSGKAQGLTDAGGGMTNTLCSPTIRNCVFQENASSSSGGAILNEGASSTPLIESCTFNNNTADIDSGAIYNWYSAPTVANCTFIGNQAGRYGGAITNFSWGKTVVINSVFYDNSAESKGGAVANFLNLILDYPIIINCTMLNNSADQSSNNGDSVWNYGSYATITNSILWGSTNNQVLKYGNWPEIDYSDVKGGYTGNGTGNINQAPNFIDDSDVLGAFGPDGTAGTIDDGLRLYFGSACINSGDNSIISSYSDLYDLNGDTISDDITMSPRIMDGNKDGNAQVDMGAYEMPNVWFVDQDENITGRNGQSWDTAFENLTDALDEARNNSLVGEIWVANGTYTPDTSSRSNSFELVDGVLVYGGFKGYSEGSGAEISQLQRDHMPESNGTELSGDIDTDGLDNGNSYHVVIGANAILDGFTITQGYADGTSGDGYGGGMLNFDASPTVVNCIFRDNVAYFGGGMLNYSASPIIQNCLFYDNESITGNNSGDGGAIYCYNSDVKIENCTISQNTAGNDAGGIFASTNSDPVIENSIIWGNSESGQYPDIQAWDNSLVTLNYTNFGSFYGDSASGGSGTGVGYIITDPLFANAASGDFHLKSQSGRWDGITPWTRDTVTSPCIDSGDPTFYYANEPLPNGGRINMGVYGNTNQASKYDLCPVSYTLQTDDGQPLPADAKWNISGGSVNMTGLDSGVVVMVPAGSSYTISFNVYGSTSYIKPGPRSVNMTSGESFYDTATYKACGWITVLGHCPEGMGYLGSDYGRWRISGESKWNGWAQIKIETGWCVIVFENVPYLTKPNDIVCNIVKGATYLKEADYTLN